MVLSFYTNWSNNHAAAVNVLFPPPELFALHDESTLYATAGIDPVFDPNYSGYSDIFIPGGAGNVFTPSPEFHPYYNLTLPEEYSMGLKLPSELPPLQEMLTYHGGGGLVTWFGGGGGDDSRCEVEVKKLGEAGKGGGGGRLSAQSMAARVRRRRISEKTQKLRKLIPGGHKMNTAEMFQAAFKYIKFLQAQIGVLKLMASFPDWVEFLNDGEMQALLTCTLMQERLYTAGKCIGPKDFAETVLNHH